MATYTCPCCGYINGLAVGSSLGNDTVLECYLCRTQLAMVLLTLDQIMVLTRAIDWMKGGNEDVVADNDLVEANVLH